MIRKYSTLIMILVLFTAPMYVNAMLEIHSAASEGDVKTLKRLLGEKQSFSEKLSGYIGISNAIDQDDGYGNTPLMFAVQFRKIRAVEFLVNRGADVDLKNKEETTALHIAVTQSNLASVNILLKAGATQFDDIMGVTLLGKASMIGNEQIVSSLIKHGARVNTSDDDGNTPLHLVFHQLANDGSTSVVKLLIDNGAKINAKNKAGNTPLDYASSLSETNKSMVELLVRHGARKNKEGESPWLYLEGKLYKRDTSKEKSESE